MRRRLVSIVACLALLSFTAIARADAPTREQLHRRSVGLSAAGGLFTAIGIALVIASPIAAAKAPEHDCGDVCFVGAFVNGCVVAAAGSVALGVGIPLLAVGADDANRAAKLRLTTITLRSERGAGIVSLSGRF
jgi:hypothetical protein